MLYEFFFKLLIIVFFCLSCNTVETDEKLVELNSILKVVKMENDCIEADSVFIFNEKILILGKSKTKIDNKAMDLKYDSLKNRLPNVVSFYYSKDSANISIIKNSCGLMLHAKLKKRKNNHWFVIEKQESDM